MSISIKGEYMKKLLLALSSVSFFVNATEDFESVGSEMMENMSEVASGAQNFVSSLSWHMKLMMFWSSLSSVYKVMAVVVLGLLVLWIVCKLKHCRKGSSCSSRCDK